MKYNKNKEFSEIKKNPSQGKRISAVRRAENMVWTAAGVYDFEPQFLSFWQDGTPDFYTNSIIGYAHKWYFTTAMQTLFSTINDSLHRDLYDGLLWFVLENCTFEREVSARPALNEMRYSYAKKFLDQESSRSRQQWMAQNSTVYALQAARCHTILGQDTGLVSTKEKKLFNELTLSGSATDQEIIHRVTSVFQQYFHYSGQPDRLTFLYRCSMRLKRNLLNHFPSRIVRNDRLFVESGSSSAPGGKGTGRTGPDFNRTADASEKDYEYIRQCFGRPLYPKEKECRLNTALCTWPHDHSHLYYTDGISETCTRTDASILQARKDIDHQEKRNQIHFDEHQFIYRSSICKLSEQIQNAILVSPVPLPIRGRSGQLATSEIWRGLFLHDDRIFYTKMEEEQPSFSVDLVLDASASCMDYQETLAAQSYVIAQSLQKCRIPVQVTSFSSLRSYTVIHRFIRYNETDKNTNLFRYFAAGWNRDGLALRAIHQLMEEEPAAPNRIAIIFTDASPNDDRKIPASLEHGFALSRDYSGNAAVKDVATEVRALKKDGIQVMAILNGNFGDTKAAREIFGKDFTRIERPAQLASAVGRLLISKIQQLS